MAENHPTLSIVLVNYNTRQLTLECLESIFRAASDLSLECIVIDNASTDGSAEAIRAAYPEVRLIANAQNRYFSAAYSQGVALASGEYVIALNSDMIIKGDALRQLVRQMQADATIGAATTTMYFPDGRLQRNCARFTPFGYLVLTYTFLGKALGLVWPTRLRALHNWLWYADWDRTTAREVDVLPGSCVIAPKAIWAATKGFDARMLMYFSDDYLSRAVQKLGKRTMYLVSDGIVHYEGASAKQMSAQALRIYLRDLLVYTRLVFGRHAQVVLALLLLPTWIVQRLKAR